MARPESRTPGAETSQPVQPALHEPLRVLVDACHQEQPVRQASTSSPREYVASPGTESSVSTRLAPLSWFELLANDAANADRGFLLSPPQTLPSALAAAESSVSSSQSPRLRPHNQRERESFQAASFHRDQIGRAHV